MKKLLRILFFLPILISAQVGAGGEEDWSYYYPPEESVSDGGAYYDGGITHVVPFAYNGHNYPDSIYAFSNIFYLEVFGSLSYYNANKIQRVFLNVGSSYFKSLDYIYNANNKVDTFSIMEEEDGIQHSFIYDANNYLIEKNTSIIEDSVPTGEEYKKIFTYSNGALTQMDYFLLPNLITPIQTDILTYNISNQLQNIELSNGVKFEYAYNSVTNFCESVILFYHDNYMDTVITREYDANGNMVRTSIKEFDLSATPPTLDEHRIMTYTYDSYNRNIKEEYWYIDTNQLTGDYVDYIYFAPPTSIKEYSTNKELLKVTDILGREVNEKRNTPLFYIYDDGTVEKRIVIE